VPMSNFFPFLGFYAVGAVKVLGFHRKDLLQRVTRLSLPRTGDSS
jgi:hypothetical protein